MLPRGEIKQEGSVALYKHLDPRAQFSLDDYLMVDLMIQR